MLKTKAEILQPEEIQELRTILSPYREKAVKIKKQRERFDVGLFIITLKNGKDISETETDPFPYLTEFRNLEAGREYFIKDLIPGMPA